MWRVGMENKHTDGKKGGKGSGFVDWSKVNFASFPEPEEDAVALLQVHISNPIVTSNKYKNSSKSRSFQLCTVMKHTDLPKIIT